MSHRIRGECDHARVRNLSTRLIRRRRGKMLGDEILSQLASGSVSAKTYARLSRWCNPAHSEPFAQPIACDLSRELFGRVIARV